MSDNHDGRTNGKRTLVDEGTEFRGGLTSTCPILVLGKIEGEVNGPALEVAPTGVVRGQIKVTELRCLGELAGQVQAETVQLAGRIREQTVISARSLEVVGGDAAAPPVQFGDCELSIGDIPDKQAAIDAAMGKAPPAVAANTEAAPAAPEAPITTERSKRMRANGSAPPATQAAVEDIPH
jgi:cytoskeletal protein CcmA (bactofilin family)